MGNRLRLPLVAPLFASVFAPLLGACTLTRLPSSDLSAGATEPPASSATPSPSTPAPQPSSSSSPPTGKPAQTIASILPRDACRADGACRLLRPRVGTESLQNAALARNGRALVFTRFRAGYNSGAADIFLVPLVGGASGPLQPTAL